jgi:hypothetical protein
MAKRRNVKRAAAGTRSKRNSAPMSKGPRRAMGREGARVRRRKAA